MDMTTRIYEYIKTHKGTSFAELSRLEGFTDENGDAFGEPSKNIIFWNQISKEAMKALKSLAVEELLLVADCGTLPYMVDGITLNMPIARQTSRTYKKPHWAPVLLDVRPYGPGSK
jgi:hypothetical protein